MGTTVRELLDQAGGGAPLRAVQPGGASSNFLGPEQLDVALDLDALAGAGSMLGSGALVVMAEGTDLLRAATNVLRFCRPQALEAWRRACAGAGCPGRVAAVTVSLEDAVGRVTAAPVWATRSSPPFDAAGMDGSRCARPTRSARARPPRCICPRTPMTSWTPVTRCRSARHAVVMRVSRCTTPTASPSSAPPSPYQHVLSVGEDVSTAELSCSRAPAPPRRHRGGPAAGSTGLLVAAGPSWSCCPPATRCAPSVPRPGRARSWTPTRLMLTAQARELGCDARCLRIEPDDAAGIAAAARGAVADCDLLIIVAGSSAGRDDHTAQVVAGLGTLAAHGLAVRPGHPVVLGAVDGTPVLCAPGYPVSAALTFEIFAAPLLAGLEDVDVELLRGAR